MENSENSIKIFFKRCKTLYKANKTHIDHIFTLCDFFHRVSEMLWLRYMVNSHLYMYFFLKFRKQKQVLNEVNKVLANDSNSVVPLPSKALSAGGAALQISNCPLWRGRFINSL